MLPQIVVHDEVSRIVTYLPAGSLTKRRGGVRGGGPRGRQLLSWDGRHEDRPWTGTNVLMVYRPGDPFSMWSAWDASDGHHVWSYVNIEEPWRRTAIGFDSRDLWLDLWREPNENAWHLKDADELAWAVEVGRCSELRAREIRDAVERAIVALERQEPPFDIDWPSWRPDPQWLVAVAPKAWRSEPLA